MGPPRELIHMEIQKREKQQYPHPEIKKVYLPQGKCGEKEGVLEKQVREWLVGGLSRRETLSGDCNILSCDSVSLHVFSLLILTTIL